jgi:hypothetical protein
VNCHVVDEPNTLKIKLLHPFIRNVQRSSAANKIIVQGSFIAYRGEPGGFRVRAPTRRLRRKQHSALTVGACGVDGAAPPKLGSRPAKPNTLPPLLRLGVVPKLAHRSHWSPPTGRDLHELGRRRG